MGDILHTIAGVAYALWGATWWRIRGGAWETLLRMAPGTTRARISAACAIALPLALPSPAALLPTAVALFLGMILAGWGDAHDIGRVAGKRLTDALAMSAWGVVATLPLAAVESIQAADPSWSALLAAPTWQAGVAEICGIAAAALASGAWWPAIVAGAAFGPLYAFAFWLADLRPLPRIPGLVPNGGATQWAELACGAGVVMAILGRAL